MQSYKDWTALSCPIIGSVNHQISRYGADKVRIWKCEHLP